MLQCWAMAFAARPEYKIIVDTHNLMKLSGFQFPSLKDSAAMYIAQVAPEWVDAPECFRLASDVLQYDFKQEKLSTKLRYQKIFNIKAPRKGRDEF